jgi:hypothetical protein
VTEMLELRSPIIHEAKYDPNTFMQGTKGRKGKVDGQVDIRPALR